MVRAEAGPEEQGDGPAAGEGRPRALPRRPSSGAAAPSWAPVLPPPAAPGGRFVLPGLVPLPEAAGKGRLRSPGQAGTVSGLTDPFNLESTAAGLRVSERQRLGGEGAKKNPV